MSQELCPVKTTQATDCFSKIRDSMRREMSWTFGELALRLFRAIRITIPARLQLYRSTRYALNAVENIESIIQKTYHILMKYIILSVMWIIQFRMIPPFSLSKETRCAFRNYRSQNSKKNLHCIIKNLIFFINVVPNS